MAEDKFDFLRKYLSQLDEQQPITQDSIYQKAIYKWVVEGQGNAIINAVAGSGKTTTLIKSLDYMNSRSSKIVVAFNKTIAEELGKRLGRKATCKTIHSLGYGMIRQYLKVDKLNLDNYKFKERIKNCANALKPSMPDNDLSHIEKTIIDVLHFTMATLTNYKDLDALLEMIQYYQIDILPTQLAAYSTILEFLLEYGTNQAIANHTITYDEMVYLPYIWDIKVAPYSQFDFILCDEAQDLNKAQLNLVLKHRKESTRLLFVGDRNQSIYGFTGANPHSFNDIKEEINAIELPLSICYRCPSSHIELAKRIVPSIEAAPNAIEGNIEIISVNQLCEIATPKDLIICRSTAPLVELAFEFIKVGIAAKVKGKDIGKSLVTIVNNISKLSGFDFDNFMEFASIYREKQIAKFAKHSTLAGNLQDLLDKIECVKHFLEGIGATCYSVDDFKFKLEGLFSDDNNTITLSTVHRAKGLEAETIFIIRSEKMPLTWANQQDWQFEQELNLQYVAFTRSKSNLYFVASREA